MMHAVSNRRYRSIGGDSRVTHPSTSSGKRACRAASMRSPPVTGYSGVYRVVPGCPRRPPLDPRPVLPAGVSASVRLRRAENSGVGAVSLGVSASNMSYSSLSSEGPDPDHDLDEDRARMLATAMSSVVGSHIVRISELEMPTSSKENEVEESEAGLSGSCEGPTPPGMYGGGPSW